MKHLMKKLSVAFMALTGLVLAGCNSMGGDTVEYLPVKTDKSSNWGLIGPDGNLLFDDEFKNEPSVMMGGVFSVSEEKGYAVYSMVDKKPKVLGDLENLTSVGMMSEGVIPVAKKGKRIEYYDKAGKLKFTLEPYKDKEIVSVDGYFHEGLARFKTEDNRYGAINAKGKVVIEPKYDYISMFRGGVTLARQYNEKNDSLLYSQKEDELKYEFIDKSGKTLATIKGYTNLTYLYPGLAIAKKEDRYGFINKKGEFTKMPEKVKNIEQYNDKLFVFVSDDKSEGVMDMNGEVIVRAKYKSVILVDNKTFICESDNDKTYLVNEKDERVKELEDVKTIIPLNVLCDMYGLSTEFAYIANEGEHEWKLYKEDCTPLDKKDYYEMDYNLRTSVQSDYFDAAAAAKKVASYVEENGFDKVQLGQPLYKYISGGNPQNYTGTDRYNFSNLESGYKYDITGYAYTNSYVARSEAKYRTETYGYYYTYTYQVFDHYDYYWNQEAIVNYINVDLDVYMDDQYENVKDALVSELKAKGYTVEMNEKPYAILKNSKNYIFISLQSSSDTSDLRMRIYTPNDWKSNRTSLIEKAVERYKDALQAEVDDRVSNPTFEESVEVVEDTVVASDSTVG